MARLQRPRTLAVVGGASLALALGVVFLPWLFPASVFRPLAAVLGSPATVLLFGVVVGVLGAQTLRETARDANPKNDDRPDRTGRSGRTDRWTPTRAPERAYYDEYRTAGEAVDSALDPDLDEVSARDLSTRRRRARKRIRATAISVVATDEAIDREAAARLVADGSWTDDPRAAAFLAGRHLAPLRTRIRDWASGERFERWATHAVAEIRTRDRGEVRGRSHDRDARTTNDPDAEDRNEAPKEVTRR